MVAVELDSHHQHVVLLLKGAGDDGLTAEGRMPSAGAHAKAKVLSGR